MCASVFARAKTDTRAPLERPRYLRGAYIMNHKKLLLTLTLCLCALLCMAVTASASEVSVHSHLICKGTTCTDPAHASHNDVTFEKAITMNDNGVLCIGGTEAQKYDGQNYDYILQEGIYYLDGDLILHGGIQVSGNVTLCLNGHTISNNYSHVIQTPWNKDVTFTLCDCKGGGKIAHAENSSSTGMGVNLNNTSGKQQIFVMYNGCITQNKGSGVYLYQNTSFTMYGGSITKNNVDGDFGGGVYVHNGATFTMYGGDITKNKADYGGGVSTSGDTANFTMYGGSITENHANKSGGGIYSTSNNISIYGGSVTNNSVTKTGKAGGIYVSSSDTLTVGGNVNISGNWKGDSEESGSKNNVYLNGNTSGTSAAIVIEKELTGEEPIGVTTANAPTAGNPVTIVTGNSIKEAYKKASFQADNAAYGVSYDGTNKVLQLHAHTGGTATCKAEAVCTTCGQPYGNINPNNHALVHHEAKAPTCTAKGWEAYDTCSRCDYTTKVEIPMAAHTYGTPTYVWAADNASCTATRTCTACQHVENETVNTQKQVTQNRSCTLNELSTFTATFTNPAFVQQIRENVTTADMTGHSYGAVSYTWATDNTNCKAEHKCTACQHVENETVNTQKQVTQNRSCTLNELSTFTATFTNTAFARQTKENVTTADMTGHTYSATEWESNVDNHWHECSVCHTQIDKAEHNWKDATYTAPKTCTVCGATQGEPLTRSYYYYAPSAAENKKDSPKTADPGVLLYAGLALASLTGLACTAKKRH